MLSRWSIDPSAPSPLPAPARKKHSFSWRAPRGGLNARIGWGASLSLRQGRQKPPIRKSDASNFRLDRRQVEATGQFCPLLFVTIFMARHTWLGQRAQFSPATRVCQQTSLLIAHLGRPCHWILRARLSGKTRGYRLADEQVYQTRGTKRPKEHLETKCHVQALGTQTSSLELSTIAQR